MTHCTPASDQSEAAFKALWASRSANTARLNRIDGLVDQLSDAMNILEARSSLLGEIIATFSIDRNRALIEERLPELMPIADRWVEREKILRAGDGTGVHPTGTTPAPAGGDA